MSDKGYLRLAEKEDMELLFRWANDPVVRKNSFSTKSITWLEHQDWFSNVLKSESVRQYIFVIDERSVGGIRVAVEDEKALLSYSVCAVMRGRGYGTQMLELIKAQVKIDFPKVRWLVGEVKAENMASRKAFLSAGYQEKGHKYFYCMKRI